MKKTSQRKWWGRIWPFIIIGILYFSGLHTEVIGQFQRLILASGLMNPAIENPDAEKNRSENIFDAGFRMKNLNTGEEKTLHSYKGEVLFVNIWATWCPPCIAELPNIQKLLQEFEDQKGIQFIMLSVDRDPQKIKEFIHKKGYDMPVYLPLTPLPEEFQSKSIPTTFVIDKKGEITMKREGMANYNTKKFKRYLKELSSKIKRENEPRTE